MTTNSRGSSADRETTFAAYVGVVIAAVLVLTEPISEVPITIKRSVMNRAEIVFINSNL